MNILEEQTLRNFESKHIGGLWECDEIREPSTQFIGTDLLFPVCFLGDYLSYFWYGNRDEIKVKAKDSSLVMTASTESERQHIFIQKEAELIAQWDILGDTNYDKLLSIFNFIQHYFKYSQEPPSLYEGYLSHQGDCLDQSAMFMEIAHNLSLKCHLVVGNYDVYPHAWVLAYPDSPDDFPIVIDCARGLFNVPVVEYFSSYKHYSLDDFLTKATQQLQRFTRALI